MSKKTPKIDELSESMQDDRILARLKTFIVPLIEEIVAQLTSTLSEKIDKLIEKKLNENFAELNKPTTDRLSFLEEENRSLSNRLEFLDNQSRMDTLIIHGLQLPNHLGSDELTPTPSRPLNHTDHDIGQMIQQFCQSRLDLQLDDSDISAVYPIQQRRGTTSKPILVKFASRSIRNKVYSARKLLRQIPKQADKSPIFINENLTKNNATIFSQARNLTRVKKIASAWTAGGFTFIKISDSPSERPKRITNLKDLPTG